MNDSLTLNLSEVWQGVRGPLHRQGVNDFASFIWPFFLEGGTMLEPLFFNTEGLKRILRHLLNYLSINWWAHKRARFKRGARLDDSVTSRYELSPKCYLLQNNLSTDTHNLQTLTSKCWTKWDRVNGQQSLNLCNVFFDPIFYWKQHDVSFRDWSLLVSRRCRCFRFVTIIGLSGVWVRRKKVCREP